MGVPKATLMLHGERLVDRATRALVTVCEHVVEVGPGYGSAPSVREDPPGQGPLAGLAAGSERLHADGYHGPVLVLAVDLPFVDVALLEWLAGYPSTDSVVPRCEGVPQSLCARYAPDAIAAAAALLLDDERSLRALLGAVPVAYVDENEWGSVADARAFLDVDTPDDMTRAGLQTPG